MSDNAGSYAFGEFDENDKELTRLKHQASIALELERGFWHKLGLEEGMDLLDVACGPGITACELARLVFPGQVTGLDINDALIQVARGVKDEQQTANVAFSTGDVYKLPYKEQFDFAYARFLFQHLERPGDALKNIFSSLRPGGRVCIVDVDDSWLSVYPKTDEFTSFTTLAAEGQHTQGGDRFVGRKLQAYLLEAGFEKPTIEVVVMNAAQLGIRSFLDITTGFKREHLTDETRAEGEELLTEIYGLCAEPGAWGAVGVFVAVAEKPKA